MTKSIILTIAIISMMVPVTAGAAPILPGYDVTSCVIRLENGEMYSSSQAVVKVINGKQVTTCQKDVAQDKRLYDLEVAVQALQQRNAQLEAGIGATGAVQPSIEARVSALETVTKAIQDSLVMIVNMLAQALSMINLRV